MAETLADNFLLTTKFLLNIDHGTKFVPYDVSQAQPQCIVIHNLGFEILEIANNVDQWHPDFRTMDPR